MSVDRRPARDPARGITHHLNTDALVTAVVDRATVGQRVLEMHDDQRTEKETMEQRRGYLDNIYRSH